MEKKDGRKLTVEQQLKIRKIAFDLLNEGFTNKEVANKLGVHEVTISKWKKKGLEIDSKGRKLGEQKSLNKNIEQKIYKELFKSKPFETNESLPFWTKDSILKMIKKLYSRDIPSSTLGDYLKRWKLNSDEVQKFKLKFIEDIGNETYEIIKKNAERKYANILWIHIEKFEEELCFIINNNTGLLILDLYNSSDLIQSFINFLLKSTKSTKKRFFLVINGLNDDQYDELNNYIQKNLNTQILMFISANLIE